FTALAVRPVIAATSRLDRPRSRSSSRSLSDQNLSKVSGRPSRILVLLLLTARGVLPSFLASCESLSVGSFARSTSHFAHGDNARAGPWGTDRENTSRQDRKSTRLHSSHVSISYAVF